MIERQKGERLNKTYGQTKDGFDRVHKFAKCFELEPSDRGKEISFRSLFHDSFMTCLLYVTKLIFP